MSRRRGSKGLGAALGVGVLFAAGAAWASQPKGSSSGGGGGSGSGKGGGGGSGSGKGGGGSGNGGGGGASTTEDVDPVSPGPAGKGRVFGDASGPSRWPADFDFGSNQVWISPDCDLVVEGHLFRPAVDASFVSAIEPTEYAGYQPGEEVVATLAVDPTNSIAGFTDWSMDRGYPDPPQSFMAWVSAHFVAIEHAEPSVPAISIVAEIVRQLSPLCMDVPDPSQVWGVGLTAWVADMLVWLDAYLLEWWGWAIDFDPTTEDELDDGPPIPDAP